MRFWDLALDRVAAEERLLRTDLALVQPKSAWISASRAYACEPIHAVIHRTIMSDHLDSERCWDTGIGLPLRGNCRLTHCFY